MENRKRSKIGAVAPLGGTVNRKIAALEFGHATNLEIVLRSTLWERHLAKRFLAGGAALGRLLLLMIK